MSTSVGLSYNISVWFVAEKGQEERSGRTLGREEKIVKGKYPSITPPTAIRPSALPCVPLSRGVIEAVSKGASRN